MNEFEVTQMLRDAIDQDPKGRVWHVNTKHLVAFAQMVAAKTKRELESSPEEFSSWVKFYEDRIAHLDEMLVKSMDMNRELMRKLSGDKNLIRTQEEFEAKIYKNYNKEDQEKWEAYLYEQGEVESKEDQRKADEAAWSEDRIACAAVRDAALNAAGEDSRAIDAAWSAYHDSCIVIDDHWDAARAKRESIYRAGIDKGRQQIIKGAEMKFDNHWLEMGACVPVDMETTAILLDEIQSLRDAQLNCYGYASRLATAIHEEHWSDSPDFRLLDTLSGVLTQIDNMTCSLVRKDKEWVGLTDDEAAECWSTSAVSSWRAIEAKLKEKNT